MKSNITQIKELLDKFYECETTESEEQTLREYFCGDVAPEFEVYAPHFRFIENESKIDHELSPSFDKKVLDAIKRYESKSVLKKSTAGYWYSFAAAASLVVIFGFYYFQDQSLKSQQTEYSECMDALILISEKMDVATNDLHKLESFENGFGGLEALIMLENFEEKIINK